MMATPHMFTGAVIGGTLHARPRLAYAAAFVSHFVLDAVPHVDPHTYFGSAEGGPTTPEAAAGVADFVVAWVVIILLTHSQAWRRIAWWSAFFGIAIDLAYSIPPWGPWLCAWPTTAWLNEFHHAIQPRLTPDQWILGFGTQAVVIAVTVGLLLHRGRNLIPAKSAENAR